MFRAEHLDQANGADDSYCSDWYLWANSVCRCAITRHVELARLHWEQIVHVKAQLPLLLALVLAGCNHQDTEALTSIAKKVQTRTEAVTGDLKTTAASSWHVAADLGVEGHVAARIRWDKDLAELAIEVLPCGTGVELRGKVFNLELHRPVMIAETTVGVEGVKDSLTETP